MSSESFSFRIRGVKKLELSPPQGVPLVPDSGWDGQAAEISGPSLGLESPLGGIRLRQRFQRGAG